MPADKEAVALILGRLKGPKGEMGMGKPETEGEGKLAAAKDIMAAIKDGDAEALSMALENHYEMCGGMMGGEGEEEGE